MSVGGRSNLERRPPSATDDPSQGVSRHRSDQASWRPNEIAQALVFPRVRRGRLCDRHRIRHRWRDERSLTKGADMDLQAAIPMFARSRRWNGKPRRLYRRLNRDLAECRRLGCGRFVKFHHARAPLEYLGDVANRRFSRSLFATSWRSDTPDFPSDQSSVRRSGCPRYPSRWKLAAKCQMVGLRNPRTGNVR
jgi:hypothetical protein